MKYILSLIMISSVLLLAADIVPQHYPPATLRRTGETAVILNLLGDTDNLQEIIFSYRVIGEHSYQEKTRDRTEIISQEVVFQLPRLAAPATGYEYFFTIRTPLQDLTLPENQPRINPYRVLAASAENMTNRFILLNPVTDVAPDQDLVFGVSMYNLENVIDMSSVALYLNGRDITRLSTFTPPLLVYTISEPSAGTYSFQIRAVAKDGKPVQSPLWNYSIIEKPTFMDNLPLDIGGQAIFTSNLRNDLDSKDDDSASVKEVKSDAAFRLNLHGRHNWLAFRSRLYLSSLESSSRQAINRFTLGFSVPHLDLDIFDSTPNYGTFLLSNNNVRGVSGRAHWGGLSLQTAYGELNRSVDGRELGDSGGFTAGTFQRNTFAGRIQIGDYRAMSIGLGFAKTKDRIASLDEKYYLKETAEQRDTLSETMVSPKDNLVLGSDLRWSIDDQRIIIGAEVAASIYNSNIIDGPLDKDTLEDYLGESIPFDPEDFETFIVINKNVEPIIPSRASMAYRIYSNMFIAGNFFTLSYSEVGASFRSLSSAYLQNDARILSITDNISLFNNQLLLDGGFNLIRDNISKQKEAKTTNLNWYVQSFFRPRNLPYLRAGYNSSSFSDDLDVSQVDQQMGTLNLGTGYQFTQIPFSITSLDVGVNLSDDKDRTEAEAFNLKRTGFQISIYNSLKDIPLVTRFNFSNTVHKEQGPIDKDDNYFRSFSLRNEYTLFRNKVRPYLNLRFSTLGGEQEDLTIANYELGSHYNPLKRTSINTAVELTTRDYKDIPDMDSSIFTWKLSITQRF